MRLTLRTLLAYLDEILDPEDAEKLRKKIDDSEFATSLVHQIRGSVRRLRLDAPALDAQGIGGDLNSIAEYLDNTLPPQHVPTLEKVCLENEVHLGEVASSHQILTLVLGEAAAVNERMRQRAYGIAPTMEREVPATAPTSNDDGDDTGEGVVDRDSKRQTTHVPHAGVPRPASSAILNAAISTNPAVDADKSPDSQPADGLPVGGIPVTTAKAAASTVSTDQSQAASENAQAASVVAPLPSPKTDSPKTDSASVKTPPVAPTTKEAWRAESEQVEQSISPAIAPPADRIGTAAKVAVGSAAVASAALVAGSASSVAAGNATTQVTALRPEYMERRSSWFRRAAIAAITALLIIMALLIAGGNGDYFARWFNGSSPYVANNNDNFQSSTNGSSASSTAALNDVRPVDRPAANANTNTTGPVQIEVVETNSRWRNSAESNFRRDESSEQLADSPPLAPPTLVAPRSNDIQPPVDAFADDAQARPFNVEASPIPGEIAPEMDNDATRASTQQPAVAANSEIDNTTEFSDILPDVEPESAFEEDPAVRLNLPPKEFAAADVPPAPTDIQSTVSRSEADRPSIPSVTAVAPLIDPAIDQQPAAIDEPVASIASTAPINSLNTRMPAEPFIPEPKIGNDSGPTKLRAGGQLLLQYDPQEEDWRRVDSRIPLGAGDVLMSLPAFQADIEIGSSMMCSLVGASRVALGPGSDLTLSDGNLILRNQTNGVSQVIHFQGERIELGFPDEDSVVAIEAYYRHIPGTEFTEAPHSILKIYAIRKAVEVSLMGQRHEIAKDEYLLMLDNYSPRVQSFKSRPDWLSSNPFSRVDDKTAKQWNRQLTDATNMRLWLQERNKNRSYNERSLAARCLAEMNEFSGVVNAMNDPDQRAYWEQHFATLQRAYARGPAVAEKLQLELEKRYGEKATSIMTMIRGYNGTQLGKDGARELVESLRHSSLDQRVLAFQNLVTITGATYGFRPEEPENKRERSVKRWIRRLTDGHVAYSKAPEVVTLLESYLPKNEAE